MRRGVRLQLGQAVREQRVGLRAAALMQRQLSQLQRALGALLRRLDALKLLEGQPLERVL